MGVRLFRIIQFWNLVFKLAEKSLLNIKMKTVRSLQITSIRRSKWNIPTKITFVSVAMFLSTVLFMELTFYSTVYVTMSNLFTCLVKRFCWILLSDYAFFREEARLDNVFPCHAWSQGLSKKGSVRSSSEIIKRSRLQNV